MKRVACLETDGPLKEGRQEESSKKRRVECQLERKKRKKWKKVGKD